MESTTAGPASPGVPGSALERWGPAAGALFAVLFVAATLVGSSLKVGSDLPEITKNFATEDYQNTMGLTFIFILLSAVSFLWFLADLTSAMRSLSEGMLSSLVPIAGVVFITAVVAAAGCFLTPLGYIGHHELAGGDLKAEAMSYVFLSGVGLALLGLAGISGALLMSAAAMLSYRGGLLPRWALILIIVGAVLAAIGTWMFFLPMLFVVLWVFVESVRRTMAYRRGVLGPLP